MNTAGQDGLESKPEGLVRSLVKAAEMGWPFQHPKSLSGNMSLYSDSNMSSFTQGWRPVTHPKPGYRCDDCGKVFTYLQGIKRHRQANHDHMKYSCICGGVYSYLGSLQRHQKKCRVYIETLPRQ